MRFMQTFVSGSVRLRTFFGPIPRIFQTEQVYQLRWVEDL